MEELDLFERQQKVCLELRHRFDVGDCNKRKFIAVCDGLEVMPEESNIIMRDLKKGVVKITSQFKALLR